MTPLLGPVALDPDLQPWNARPLTAVTSLLGFSNVSTSMDPLRLASSLPHRVDRTHPRRTPETYSKKVQRRCPSNPFSLPRSTPQQETTGTTLGSTGKEEGGEGCVPVGFENDGSVEASVNGGLVHDDGVLLIVPRVAQDGHNGILQEDKESREGKKTSKLSISQKDWKSLHPE